MGKVRCEWDTTVSVAGLIIMAVIAAGCSSPPPAEMVVATDVTVFEGARLIVGDGSDPIENAVFVVDEDRFMLVGTTDDVVAPAGATRVDLSGRTVMPAIIDTHVHTRTARAELVEDLERKAYYGVGAVLSLGRDDGGPPFEIRNEAISNAALFRTVGRGITSPEPGRTEIPYWITSEEEARTAVQELAVADVAMVKIWVDDRNGQFEKLSPELYGAVIDEAHAHELRVTAHIFALEDAKGLLRSGIDAFAHGIRSSGSIRMSCWCRIWAPAGWLRILGGSRGPFLPSSSRRYKRASLTGRMCRSDSVSKLAILRASTRQGSASGLVPTVTLVGASTLKWLTWWRPG